MNSTADVRHRSRDLLDPRSAIKPTFTSAKPAFGVGAEFKTNINPSHGVDFCVVLPSHHHHEIPPHRVPPLPRGMWAGSIRLAVDDGIQRGGAAGGTQEVGGPLSASRNGV